MSSLYFRFFASRFALLLLLHALVRLCFYSFNHSAFSDLGFFELCSYFLFALRFDALSLGYANLPFLLYHLAPWPGQFGRRGLFLSKLLFFVGNIALLAWSLASALYYPFAGRHLQSSDLLMLNDFWPLLPGLLLEFSWAIVLFALLLWLAWRLYQFLPQSTGAAPSYKSPWLYVRVLVLFFCTALALRGGWQLRPLSPSAAAVYVSKPHYQVLVSNAGLQLLHSLQASHIAIASDWPEAAPRFEYLPDETRPFRAQNVCIIALESMGREYVGYYQRGEASRTPFLDSLLAESWHWSNAYANGTRSAQGMVAILAGIPALLEEPLHFSSYQSLPFRALGSLLKEEGYSRAFFHGGKRGTMDFDKLAAQSGIESYHGKEDYEAQYGMQDYDGAWGIWDRAFYRYSLEEIDKLPQPWFALYFSLNPHHPFLSESDIKKSYPEETALQQSIRYADKTLQEFMYKASKSNWYAQTLFIFVADHTGPPQEPLYQQSRQRYKIPIAFYAPGDSSLRGQLQRSAQQIDILPTVLGYLNYPKKLGKLFGQDQGSPKAKNRGFLSYDSGMYCLIDSNYTFYYDGREARGLFADLRDSFCQEDLSAQKPELLEALEKQSLQLLRQHHEAILNNDL